MKYSGTTVQCEMLHQVLDHVPILSDCETKRATSTPRLSFLFHSMFDDAWADAAVSSV